MTRNSDMFKDTSKRARRNHIEVERVHGKDGAYARITMTFEIGETMTADIPIDYTHVDLLTALNMMWNAHDEAVRLPLVEKMRPLVEEDNRILNRLEWSRGEEKEN